MSFLASPRVSALSNGLATPAASLVTAVSPPVGASGYVSRDSAVADLATVFSSVNSLAKAAVSSTAANASSSAAAAGSSAADQLTLPPLPAMPSTPRPPSAPSDDHGSSNVVFSDADSDSSLIH